MGATRRCLQISWLRFLQRFKAYLSYYDASARNREPTTREIAQMFNIYARKVCDVMFRAKLDI